MGDREEVLLENIIDWSEFSAMQNELANLVEFSVVTVNTEGIPIGSMSNFTPFCQLVRSSPLGRKGCEACDYQATLQALRIGKPFSYICHCGLQDCTAPITVDGVYIGGVLGGQAFIREEDRKKVDVTQIAHEYHLSQKELEQALANVKVVSEDYLQRCLRFYSFMANYFAEMEIKKITQEKLARETRERMRLQQIAQEQELKRMQAQMDPHFLFNALNSLARTALLEGADQTENLIYDLSNYLRYSIKNAQETPKLSQELENLQHYLSIQTTRFGDRIRFVVDVEPELLDWCVPSMTLQPIVENAIVHGLENRAEGGLVEVRGVRGPGKDKLLLSVRDNGVGIPPAIVALFQGDGDLEEAPELGLGLLNTNERIKRLYGEQYGLKIESEIGVFSRITICLPKRIGERHV